MTPSDIARFLADHPAFFDEYPDLLAEIVLPHPQGNGTISLTERQLLALREKIRQLEGKLAELLHFGEENDELSEKVQRLALSLFEATDFLNLRMVLLDHLVEDFGVPHAAFRVWGDLPGPLADEFAGASEALQQQVGEFRHPYCGPAQDPEVIGWFGETGTQVHSLALIPLARDGQVFGVLALGSEQAEYFHAGMDTLYLRRIGELLAAALKRLFA